MTNHQANRRSTVQFVVSIALSVFLGCATTVAVAQNSKLSKKIVIVKHDPCDIC
jgi:hypothetical protein